MLLLFVFPAVGGCRVNVCNRRLGEVGGGAGRFYVITFRVDGESAFCVYDGFVVALCVLVNECECLASVSGQ